MILISGLVQAAVVLVIGLKSFRVLNVGSFAHNFEHFGERGKKYILSGSSAQYHVYMNDIGSCYMNQRHNKMPFRTLTKMVLLIFSVSNDFTHF